MRGRGTGLLRAGTPGLACAMALSVLAAPAAGHTRLVRTVPAEGGVLAEPPTAIRLVFDDGVVATLSGVTVIDGAGERTAPCSAVPGDDTQVVVPLEEPLTDGVVRVRWRVVSEDMHTIEGDFSFEVAP